MIKLPLFIIAWGLYLLIELPTALVGFFIGPILYLYRTTEYSDLPFWTRPWANPEDWLGQQNHFEGGLPKWWVLDTDVHPSYEGRGTGFRSWYAYNIFRNPANGLRSFEWLDLDIDPQKIEYKTNGYIERYAPPQIRNLNRKFAWYFAWQGYRAGFKIVRIWPDKKKPIKFFKWTPVKAGPKHLVIKFGWRVEPSDTKGIGKGIGTEDTSFASKFLFYRDG